MKVTCGILLVLMAAVYVFAADPTEAEKQAATAASEKSWDVSYQEAVALFPDVADENSELSKAVRADIDAIRADPAHPLRDNPTLPMILVQRHAARLGISPRAVAGADAEKAPVTQERKYPTYSVDDEARILQLTLAGLSREKAEMLVAGRRGSAVSNPTSEYQAQQQQRLLEDRARMEREAQMRDQARDDQLTDDQRRTADRLTLQRRQAELDQMRVEQQRLDQQRLDRQIRDERVRREVQEAERQRARDRD